MAQVWEFDARQWPAKFGRKWLWTIFAEKRNHEKVIATCQKGGITDLCILLNDSPAAQPNWAVRGREVDVVALCELARQAGITPHISTWIDPKQAYVTAAAAGMLRLTKAARPASIVLDLEGEWRKRIKNHGQFVVTVLAPAFAGFPVPIGITSFAGLPSEVVPALAWAVKEHKGYGQPQAYSVFQGKKWQFSANLQPDQLSSLAWRTWSPITRRLVILQAAYGNPIPGRGVSGGKWVGQPWGIAESIEVAAQRAERDGFPEIGWWSEEALSGGSRADVDRLAAMAEIKATGKSLVGGRGWRRVALWGGALAAAAGGLAYALRGR